MDGQPGWEPREWDVETHVRALEDAGALLVSAIGDRTGSTEGARIAAAAMAGDEDVDWEAVAVATASVAGAILRALTPSTASRERAMSIVPELVAQQRTRWSDRT